MQRTLRSPGLFTWNPSVSWVVGVRCHCPGEQNWVTSQAHLGWWGLGVLRWSLIQICAADGTVV